MSTTLNEVNEQLKSLNKVLSEVITKKTLDPESPDTSDLQFLITKVQYACKIANNASEITNNSRILREFKLAIEDVLNDLKNPEIMGIIKNKSVDKLKVFVNIPALTSQATQTQSSFFTQTNTSNVDKTKPEQPQTRSKRAG